MTTCQACILFDKAERAALAGEEMPPHDLGGEHTCMEPTLSITVFGPQAMFRSPHQGTAVELTWAEVVRFVSVPVITTDKASAGGFCMAKLRDGIRRLTHIETASALPLDHDSGHVTAETAHRRLGRFRHVVYSTWSSTAEIPKWRAIIACTRPMLEPEYRTIWAHAARVIDQEAKVDHACSDPVRFWFTPAVRPGATHLVFEGDGEVLDVDRLLAWIAASRPKPHVRPAALRASTPLTGNVRDILEREARDVETAPEGTRNRALNKAAFSLAGLTKLSASEIKARLLRAAKVAGLSENEAAKTIASGIAGRGRSS